MYYAYKLLEIEKAERAGKKIWKEFFVKKRNQRAAQSSFFVMFMQQFCGVNVIGKYLPLFQTGADLQPTTRPRSLLMPVSPSQMPSWYPWVLVS
jgi:hypothetical protein